MKEKIKEIVFNIRKLKYRAHKSSFYVHQDWSLKHFNRIAVVNKLASKLGAHASYLEIGCQDNLLFDAVPILNKFGVDPERGGTHRMTSDQFFLHCTSKFDLVFIDGLHTIEQVSRDLENAISTLNIGGFIVIHDLLPRNWMEQTPKPANRVWLGDVWKLSAHIIKFLNVFQFYIVNVDHGVGVLQIKPNADIPKIDIDALRDLKFDDFRKLKSKLDLRSFEEFLTLID